MLFKLILCVLTLLVSVSHCRMDPTEEYVHSATLRSGNIILYWKFTESNITFEVHGQTTGWIGIGFSPNGGMNGADLVVGWVKEGKVTVTDRHGIGNSFPPMDAVQNLNVITGRECEGWTMFKFSRELAACENDHDREITSNTMRLIWAYSENDPEGKDIEPKHYHGTKRGVESMYFLEPVGSTTNELLVGPTYGTIDVFEDEFHVPPEETYYNCKLFKLPDLKQKSHIVKFEPIIQEGNELNVHHIVLYQCGDVMKNSSELGVDERCHSPNMEHFESCKLMLTVWAIGGGPIVFPEEAGLSLGTPGDPKYIQLEVHYDNPLKESNIIDSSGIRITYTTSLRKNDAGVFYVGSSVTPLKNFIPPGAKSFLRQALCADFCFENAMQESGTSKVTMFNVLLHAHLTGRALKLRQFRNGTELPPIAYDDTYDFNYQEGRLLDPTVDLRPEDSLVMECYYNTEDRTEMTEGGLGTYQEMCFAFVQYYPKIDISGCVSAPPVEDVWSNLGLPLQNFTFLPEFHFMSLRDIKVKEEKTAIQVLKEYDWTEENIEKFSKSYNTIIHDVDCSPRDVTKSFARAVPMPSTTKNYEIPRRRCSSSGGATSSYVIESELCLNKSATPTISSIRITESVLSKTKPPIDADNATIFEPPTTASSARYAKSSMYVISIILAWARLHSST